MGVYPGSSCLIRSDNRDAADADTGDERDRPWPMGALDVLFSILPPPLILPLILRQVCYLQGPQPTASPAGGLNQLIIRDRYYP